MSGSRTELYVYYRVAVSNREAALKVVRDLQQRLCSEHPGLSARVLRRTGERADAVTLMEVYTFDDGRAGGIDDGLRARIDAAAVVLAPLLAGPRQVESFAPLD